VIPGSSPGTELISATTTKPALRCAANSILANTPAASSFPTPINIKRAEFHGDWNYTISPNTYPPNCAFIFLTYPKWSLSTGFASTPRRQAGRPGLGFLIFSRKRGVAPAVQKLTRSSSGIGSRPRPNPT
jgi:hypothetical protein